jgi:hypothetical protein
MDNPITIPGQQQNMVPPDLTAYMRQRKFEFKAELNCIGIGTVNSFNSTEQTVDVTLNYMRVVKGGVTTPTDNGSFANDLALPQPMLVRCPLMILQGGGAYITFPITAGDIAVVLFNDRDMDTWWATGSTAVPPNTPRLHDFSDALCFIGVRALPNAIQNYFNGFKIQYAGTSLTIDPSGNITITGVDNSAFTITGNINITSPDNITITGASINLI